MDSKIEEATRPVAAQRAEAAQEHSALDEEVEELRYELGALPFMLIFPHGRNSCQDRVA